MDHRRIGLLERISTFDDDAELARALERICAELTDPRRRLPDPRDELLVSTALRDGGRRPLDRRATAGS